jgi:hypothetical protein
VGHKPEQVAAEKVVTTASAKVESPPRTVNASHRFRGSGEEVPAAVGFLVPNQSQVGLVDKGGGVEGVPRSLGGHLRCGKLPQFVVHEGEQFCGGPAVSLLGGFE